MLTYEMPILLRVMTKMVNRSKPSLRAEDCLGLRATEIPHTTEALKRIAGRIFDRGGVIRQIDNLGEQPTPYKTSAHGVSHRRAHYFVLHFNVPPRKIEDFKEECERDVDLIRSNVFKTAEDEKPKPCTFHEEMLPPAYRPQVQKLVQIASRQKAGYTMEWKWNSGLDFYPFQR